MKIKIFQANWVIEVESEINKWLSENPNIEIIDVKPHSNVMYDMYESQPPTVCNQWLEYTWTVIYKENNS